MPPSPAILSHCLKSIEGKVQFKKMSLPRSDITTSQIISLAQTILLHPFISKIDLSENRIGDDGAIALLQTMRAQLLHAFNAMDCSQCKRFVSLNKLPRLPVENKGARKKDSIVTCTCGNIVYNPSIDSSNMTMKRPVHCLYSINLNGNAVFDESLLREINDSGILLAEANLKLEAELVFDTVDEDHSGYIGADEVMKAMHRLTGKRVSAKEVQGIISVVDQDGDGRLDRDEFTSMVLPSIRSIKKLNVSGPAIMELPLATKYSLYIPASIRQADGHKLYGRTNTLLHAASTTAGSTTSMMETEMLDDNNGVISHGYGALGHSNSVSTAGSLAVTPNVTPVLTADIHSHTYNNSIPPSLVLDSPVHVVEGDGTIRDRLRSISNASLLSNNITPSPTHSITTMNISEKYPKVGMSKSRQKDNKNKKGTKAAGNFETNSQGMIVNDNHNTAYSLSPSTKNNNGNKGNKRNPSLRSLEASPSLAVVSRTNSEGTITNNTPTHTSGAIYHDHLNDKARDDTTTIMLNSSTYNVEVPSGVNGTLHSSTISTVGNNEEVLKLASISRHRHALSTMIRNISIINMNDDGDTGSKDQDHTVQRSRMHNRVDSNILPSLIKRIHHHSDMNADTRQHDYMCYVQVKKAIVDVLPTTKTSIKDAYITCTSLSSDSNSNVTLKSRSISTSITSNGGIECVCNCTFVIPIDSASHHIGNIMLTIYGANSHNDGAIPSHNGGDIIIHDDLVIGKSVLYLDDILKEVSDDKVVKGRSYNVNKDIKLYAMHNNNGIISRTEGGEGVAAIDTTTYVGVMNVSILIDPSSSSQNTSPKIHDNHHTHNMQEEGKDIIVNGINPSDSGGDLSRPSLVKFDSFTVIHSNHDINMEDDLSVSPSVIEVSNELVSDSLIHIPRYDGEILTYEGIHTSTGDINYSKNIDNRHEEHHQTGHIIDSNTISTTPSLNVHTRIPSSSDVHTYHNKVSKRKLIATPTTGSSNRVHRVSGVTSVTLLDFSNRKLTGLSHLKLAWSAFLRLHTLILSHNNLTSFDVDIIPYISTMKVLDISYNDITT